MAWGFFTGCRPCTNKHPHISSDTSLQFSSDTGSAAQADIPPWAQCGKLA